MNKLKTILILFIFTLITPTCLAICEEGQIDINSASAEELDEIIYIGLSRAEQIIDLRPFDSVDDLIEVSGIGEIYLDAIKEQGLACVDEEDSTDDEEQEEDEEKQKQEDEEEEQSKEDDESKEETETLKDERNSDKDNLETDLEEEKIKNITLEPINLNSEDIKDKNEENPEWTVCGFIAFCVLLGFLFIERKRRLNKNEFE